MEPMRAARKEVPLPVISAVAVFAALPRSVHLYPFCPRRPCGQCLHFYYSLTCRRTLVAAPSARTRSHGSNTRTASLLTFIYPPFTALGLLKLASVAQYRAAITRWLTLSIVPLCPPTSRHNLLQSSMDSLGPLLLLRVRTIGQRLFHRFGLYVTVSSPLPRAD